MIFQDIIKNLKEICKKEELDVSPDCLFENAIKLKISENIDKSHKEMYNKEKVNPKPFEPATEKQVNFLKKIKKYQENMSKQEAFKIIQGLGKKEY